MVGREVGPYRILQKIAQGGMSTVFKGLHTGLEQEVAIKVLSPESFEDPCLRERFISEAKIQAKLSHPNVLKVLNYLEHEGAVFFVMEYVNGESLDVLLKKIGSLPVARAVEIFAGILDAIEFMHSKGIIHRDIKPANIMLSYDRYVKVMDFGIAKVMGENGKTKAGIRIGTLWYMSPEQIRGEEATSLTDIYSLGVTLYQMVTGQVPFSGEQEFDVMRGHLEESPVPPWKIKKEIKKELGEVILKALSKKPKDRYQSIREFSEALKAAMNTPGMCETKVYQMPETLPGTKMHRARGKLIFALSVLTIAVLTALAGFMFHGKGDQTVSPADKVQPAEMPREIGKIAKPDEIPAAAGISEKEKWMSAESETDGPQKRTPAKQKSQKRAIIAHKQSQDSTHEMKSGQLRPTPQAPAEKTELPAPEVGSSWSIRK